MFGSPHRPHQVRPSVTSASERGDSAMLADESMVNLRCSVVVIRGSDVLLLHRSAIPEDPHDGDWVLPGGRPRPGESMVACARRETVEETGLDVVVQGCLYVLEVSPHHQGTGSSSWCSRRWLPSMVTRFNGITEEVRTPTAGLLRRPVTATELAPRTMVNAARTRRGKGSGPSPGAAHPLPAPARSASPRCSPTPAQPRTGGAETG
jgi:hypothetical protein